MLRPDIAGGIAGLGDVARRGLRLVNRKPGSAARSMPDRELADLGIDPGQLPGCDAATCGQHVATLPARN